MVAVFHAELVFSCRAQTGTDRFPGKNALVDETSLANIARRIENAKTIRNPDTTFLGMMSSWCAGVTG